MIFYNLKQSSLLSVLLLTTILCPAANAQDQDPGPLPTHVTDNASVMDLPDALPRKASKRVETLLAKMTLEEKLGQLNQVPGGRSKTLNSKLTPDELNRVRAGRVGSYLHVAGAQPLRELQRVATEESRLKIPLLFALDVVHGYRTIFPVPIAIASSWEPEQWERTARVSAIEAGNSGVHWTFAPMVDVTRDPRWGRVVEGAGEDTYLGSIMAAAQVRGYQGDDLTARERLWRPQSMLVLMERRWAGAIMDQRKLASGPCTKFICRPFMPRQKQGQAVS